MKKQANKPGIIYWWFPLLLVFQLVDCVQTSMAGIHREANPLMVLVWGSLGWEVAVGIKMLTVVVVGVTCYLLHHPKNPLIWMRKVFHIEIAGTLCIFLGVCIWNLMQLRR